MKVSRLSNHSAGFTILEVVMGLAVITLIFGGIFSVASGAMDLSKRSSLLREAEIRITQFGQVLRNAFAQLSPGSEIEVRGSSLLISNPGQCLQWPGVPAGVSDTRVGFNDGSISVIHYLGDVEAAKLVLIDQVSSATWQVFDPITQQWLGAWLDEPQAKASLIRLRYTAEGESGFRENVFRIPPFTSLEFKPPEAINENERAD